MDTKSATTFISLRIGLFSRNFLQAVSKLMKTSSTCSGQNGTTGVKWAHPVQLDSPALPDFIDETETTKENRI